MRIPTWCSSVFRCSSCWPSSSRKSRGSSKRSAAGAETGSVKGSAAPGPEQVVGGGQRLVEAGGILAARLREVGPPAPATAHQRRELLDDVASVEAADQVLGDGGEQERALALRRAEDDDARLDPLAQAIRHVAEALVVEPFDPRREDRDAVHATRVGEEIAHLAAGKLRLELRDPLLELALLGEELLDLRGRLVGRSTQQRAHLFEDALLLVDQLERPPAGRGLDPAHPRRNAALAADLHE